MIPIAYLYFPGGKKKALTLSYDDGVTQDRRLVEIMNRHGLKGTFHVNSGLAQKGGNRLPLTELAELYRGHEISVHSVTHPSLASLPVEQVAWEILEDRRQLEAIANYTVRGMSYPNGSYDPTIISHLPHYGIEYARTTKSHGKFSLPDNFLEWHPTAHHTHNISEKADEFLAIERVKTPLLFYLWGHSYEFDWNKENNNWEIIEAFAAKMGQAADSIWFATNIEIYDYLTALRRLRISVDGRIVENPTNLSLWISHNNEPREIGPGERIILQ